MSTNACGRRWVRITSETDSEVQRLTFGPWVQGRPLGFDLSHYDKLQLFDRIDRKSGLFNR